MDNIVEKKFSKKKVILTILSLFLIAGIGVGVTISYLVAKSDLLVNTFTPGKVTTEVVETFNGNVKENVQIKNTGDVPAYIRAAVVVNWLDAEGKIAGADTSDYSITFETGFTDGWFQHIDGYYYHKAPVTPHENTSVLIESARPLVNKDGYTLSIEILASGIQSEGVNGDGKPAVETAWPVTVDDNGLLDKE